MISLALRLAAALSTLALSLTSASAQDLDGQDLFKDDSLITVKIEAPLNTLFKKERETGNPVAGTLTVSAPGYETQTLAIKLETRGKTRRDSKVCKFPPLTVNFKKKDVKHTLFDHQNKLKLVTHCQNSRASYNTYYLQEYLLYKTYNLITEESFRVRLGTFDYVDTEGKQSIGGKYGFFIEDADNLAKRLGRERRDVKRVSTTLYQTPEANRVALFQYMIGNLDWAILGGPEGEKCCHNTKPYFATNGMAIPVPYDFDYAGVINANYAVPPASLKVKSVRTRLYRGFCAHDSALPKTIESFKEKKTAIYALTEGSSLLPDKTARSMIKYYDDFFETLEDPAKVDRYLHDKCR